MTTNHASIRNATPEDIDRIGQLTIAAFAPLKISGHTEQFIIEALRGAEALSVSLVADINGEVVGHIAFSPVAISDGRKRYGLGPVLVLAQRQQQGVGKTLIGAGLARLRRFDASGCCLVGPPAYYR